jgi:hypothetical protein
VYHATTFGEFAKCSETLGPNLQSKLGISVFNFQVSRIFSIAQFDSSFSFFPSTS